MLYLQNLIGEKLCKESHLRKYIAHKTLDKQLQHIQMEGAIEDCVPAAERSESFAVFQLQNPAGVCEWARACNADTTTTCSLSDEYASLTLDSPSEH
jgi:hypothetical protein